MQPVGDSREIGHKRGQMGGQIERSDGIGRYMRG